MMSSTSWPRGWNWYPRSYLDVLSIFGLALIVLVNNWVLKYEFPGFVTGKLSDLCGVLLLCLLLDRFFALLGGAYLFYRINPLVAAAYLAWIKMIDVGTTFHEILVNKFRYLWAHELAGSFQLVQDTSDVWVCLALVPVWIGRMARKKGDKNA